MRYIYLFLPEEVAAYGVRLSCPVVAIPTMQGGERMYLWRIDVDSAGLEETSSDSSHGTYYKQSIPFNIKRNRVESTMMAQMLRNNRIHAVIEDYQGEQLLMKAAKLSSKREINTNRRSYNGYSFNLRSNTRLPLPHIKDVPLYGVIDCSDFYTNILIPEPPISNAPEVLTDDFQTVLTDDFGNVINHD